MVYRFRLTPGQSISVDSWSIDFGGRGITDRGASEVLTQLDGSLRLISGQRRHGLDTPGDAPPYPLKNIQVGPAGLGN